eukprot:8631826-Pyramimonas_sp.AAC.1
MHDKAGSRRVEERPATPRLSRSIDGVPNGHDKTRRAQANSGTGQIRRDGHAVWPERQKVLAK